MSTNDVNEQGGRAANREAVGIMQAAKTELAVIALIIVVIEAAFLAAIIAVDQSAKALLFVINIAVFLIISLGLMILMYQRMTYENRRYQNEVRSRAENENQLYRRIEGEIQHTVTQNTMSRGQAEALTQIIRRAGFVSVNLRPIAGPEGGVIEMAYEPTATVSDFLDRLYLSYLKPLVPSYAYGEKWVLQDDENKREFTDIGSKWARNHNMPRDTRELKEIGIIAGMKLNVLPR